MGAHKSDFIVNDLISKIYQQKLWRKKLPTQRELAASYRVSRFTIQKVIKQLQNIGLVQTIQGDGIYIQEKALGNPMVYNSLTEVSYREIQSKMIYLNQIPATAELASIFNLNVDDPIWEFQRLRIVKFEMSQIETGYMPCKLFPDLTQAILEDSIQNYVLKKRYKISHHMTSYQPALPTKQEAMLLNCKKSTPVMVISNRGILKGGSVFILSSITAIHYVCTYVVPFNTDFFTERRK